MADRGSKLVGKNEAEKILFALEASRHTPLKSADSAAAIVPGGSIPADLVGASSRTLRKAISVPLATAMAGDTARGRREKERAEDKGRGVSAVISPYGRRRQVDEAHRESSRQTRERDDDYRQSSQIARSSEGASDRSSRAKSVGTDYDMRSESEADHSPSPTPRRSHRLKRRDGSPQEGETTPKARKTKRGKAAGESSRATAKQPSPSKGKGKAKRRATSERSTSPAPPEGDRSVPPVPHVPTITETAPSPDAKSSSSSSYQPRADGDRAREASSLRAKSSVSKRTHGQSASLNNSRATSPNGTGRFSAREEDLPPMEELEAPKIPFNSFSGISFSNLNTSKPPPQQQDTPVAPSTTPAKQAESSSSSLLGRLGPPPAKAESHNTLGIPRISSGPLSRINSSRPRASSPLASSSIVAVPESPPVEPPVKSSEPPSGGIFPLASEKSSAASTTPTKPPPLSLFAGVGGGQEPKKSLGAGLGKPSSQPVIESASQASNGTMPDFFGKKSQPTSGSATPTTQSFNFGIPAQPQPSQTAHGVQSSEPKPFSFGAGADGAETKANGIGAGNFFGQPKVAEGEKPVAEATKPFSVSQTNPTRYTSTNAVGPQFGTSTASPSPAAENTSKPAFSFGQSSSSTPTSTSNGAVQSTEPPKPFAGFAFAQPAGKPNGNAAPQANANTAPASSTPFSFNKPAESAPAAEAPKPAFSFGQSAIAEPKTDAAPAAVPASSPFGGFGSSSSSTPSAGPALGPSTTQPSSAPLTMFGKAVSDEQPSKKRSSSSFGDDSASGPNKSPFGGFGSSSSTAMHGANGSTEQPKSNPFGGGRTSSSSFGGFGSSSGPATQTNQVNGTSHPFGQSTASSTPSTFSFGASATAAVPSNSFGQPAVSTPPSNPFSNNNSQSVAAASPGNGSFNFNFAAPSPSANGSAAPSPSANFSFGQQPSPVTPNNTGGGFSFGSGSQPASNQPFVFGSGGGGNDAGSTPGSGNAPRFGSPAPSGDGSGFNLGMQAETPGSPGSRKIKPLRRTAKR